MVLSKTFSENKIETSKIIEDVIGKNVYEKYYDKWIQNFSLNLHNIWEGKSAKELAMGDNNSQNSAIVIGRGPSLIKNNHLELLAKSNFKGVILCTDAILKTVLESGVTPNKFDKFFVVSIDSQDHQKKFYEDDLVLKYGKKIKCILSTTISPITYEAAKKTGMEVFWLHTLFDYNKGKSSFNYISAVMTRTKNHKNGLPAIQTGGNVATSSWVIGWSIFKCSQIALIGVDHSFSPETKLKEIGDYHPSSKAAFDYDKESDLFKKAFPKIYNPDFNCYCIQDPISQYYSTALKEFIFKTSDRMKTINATEEGALFGDGIRCMNFKDFLSEYKS